MVWPRLLLFLLPLAAPLPGAPAAGAITRAASASARSASNTISSSMPPPLDRKVHGNGEGRVMSPLVKSSLDGMMGFPSAPVAGTMSKAHSKLWAFAHSAASRKGGEEGGDSSVSVEARILCIFLLMGKGESMGVEASSFSCEEPGRRW